MHDRGATTAGTASTGTAVASEAGLYGAPQPGHEGEGAVAVGKALRVLIAENHPDLSEAVARIIDSEPDMLCVGQVPSVAEVLPAARDSAAEVIILDLSLTGGSSMQLIEELATQLPDLRIVVFSGLANAEEAARETKKRGAAEFVAKGCDFNVLLDALRRTAAAA
jgi:two-component system, NarL family, response regulator DesR